jgi:hypothetical protein
MNLLSKYKKISAAGSSLLLLAAIIALTLFSFYTRNEIKVVEVILRNMQLWGFDRALYCCLLPLFSIHY